MCHQHHSSFVILMTMRSNMNDTIHRGRYGCLLLCPSQLVTALPQGTEDTEKEQQGI
jgi:hypothetical protein